MDLLLISNLYEFFYLKIYAKNPEYKFQPSSKSLKFIESFISIADKKYGKESLGLNFLFDYFIFQFTYWYDLEITAFYGKMQIQYIIGEKAFERWLNRDKSFDWTIKLSKILTERQITKTEFVDLYNTAVEFKILKSEETEKNRFYGTERGFLNCIESTSLFNNMSKLCLSCKFKQQCLIMLKNNYKNLYDRRYGEQRQINR